MATTTLSTVARANLRASKKKYILTGIGIAISSFFISAVLMLTSSLQATLDATIGDIYANSQNVVISAGAANQDDANSTAKFPMSNDTIKKLQESPEVSSSWILYSFSGTYGADKEKVTYASTPPSKDLAPFDIEGNLPSKDTELLVAKSFAEKHNLKIGDKVTMPNIVTSATDKDNAKDTEYTLTATFSTGISDSQMSDNVFIGGTSLADIARQLADEEGGIVSDPSKPMAPQAFIKLKNDTQESRDALQKELNTGDKNTTPKVFSNTQMMDHLKKQLSSLFDALGTILVAFAILALLVSSFVISNTFAVLVGQRTRELALLRTLGARGGSLVRMLLMESLVIGLFFSIIGSAAVYAVGGILNAMFSTFIVSFSPVAFIVGVLMCTVVTVLASLAPARTALRISPISAMSANTEQAVKKPSIIGGIIGVVLAIAGGILTTAALKDNNGGTAITTIMWACLLYALAVFLLTPWILLPLVRIIGSVLRGQTGKLALANSLRSPKRTVSTGRAVLVGTLVIGIVLTGHSVLSTSIAKELDRLYPVTAYAPFGESSVTNSSASVTKAKNVADKIKGLKNVEAVSVGSAAGVIEYTAKPDNADSINLKDNVMSLSNDDLHKVSTGESNINLKDDEVLVPQDIWDLGKFDNNTRLKLTGPLGTVEAKPIKAETKEPFFVVNPATGAKVQDASNPQPATNEQAMPEDPAAQEALMKAAKENPALARSFAARGTATMVLMRAKTPLTSSDNSQLQSELAKANDGTEFQGGLSIRKSNDQTLSIMLNASLILLALAVVIAVIGVANTMTLSVNERRRENAMLRSLGLSRKQLRRMVSTEAVMITLGALAMGIVSGVLIGLVLSRVLVRAIREAMEMVPALPITGMVLVLVVGLFAAFAASAIPAFRSARQSPVEGLRSR
ncbi:MAG: FtsX-like permease family protein [Rothia sp. (in: high G+C Gram-positive bacteria)]|uniref:FtsX-like permease family protein n=1 Tax=Rothia sp. (in: high G+C Gram-positive bacteria) TaxID=1885016 RepID=UPI0026DD10E5|nr:FtsX-like permease family protein [Rothia sp. (in: high G+C Gram-positive bacteria)]MDO4884610.1 FtsX-like permease family protein [Rothia sp. (in: high G+C Gram-positive bacteria)]